MLSQIGVAAMHVLGRLPLAWVRAPRRVLGAFFICWRFRDAGLKDRPPGAAALY